MDVSSLSEITEREGRVGGRRGGRGRGTRKRESGEREGRGRKEREEVRGCAEGAKDPAPSGHGELLLPTPPPALGSGLHPPSPLPAFSVLTAITCGLHEAGGLPFCSPVRALSTFLEENK